METCAKPPEDWHRHVACVRKEYHTIPRAYAKVKHENTKKLTERIPVSHTLNLLRNGKILQKGHIIYTGNAKSQISSLEKESRWNEWGIQTIGKPTDLQKGGAVGTVLAWRTGCRARHERGELYNSTMLRKSQERSRESLVTDVCQPGVP